ncbi:urease accessory protein UreF [Natronomonas sp.]|uniref:urease accessory protein UreF n=1 Tax=Natronomonas sp. TaxID=2184060 RepID=UPI0026286C3D|nr:urease accessory UreF family protein [Natronomonas sp.]
MSDASFLAAMRLADSFLPVGTYTASYGIEQYLTEDRIETADELGALIEGYLRRIVGPADTVALANAHRAAASGSLADAIEADERLHAATLPAEFRTSSTKAGSKLLELLEETDPALFGTDEREAETEGSGSVVSAYADAVEAGETPGSYPVALGVVTEAMGIDERTACLVSGYSFVTELLGAAQRLGRFGHTEIQSRLAGLLAVVEAVCERYVDAALAELTSFAPLAETMGMAHERAERRLFMS